MTEALEVRQPAPVARSTAGALVFTPEQRKMIREMYAPGASESEFGALIAIAEARGLNPLLKQVYFVKRWDSARRMEVWAVQGSIDGLRAIAQRTGLYDGQGEPRFEYDSKNHPRVCRVEIYRKDWSRPAVGVAHWDEYAQTKKDGGFTSFWAGKPHIMLAKCAEALGLRKAFPEDTGGIYIAEEMGEKAAADAARDITPARAPIAVSIPDEDPPAPAQLAEKATEPPHDPQTGEVAEPARGAPDLAGLAAVLKLVQEHEPFNAQPHADNWWKAHWEEIQKLAAAEQKVIRRALNLKIVKETK